MLAISGLGQAGVQIFKGTTKMLGVEGYPPIAAMGIWAVWKYDHGSLAQRWLVVLSDE